MVAGEHSFQAVLTSFAGAFDSIRGTWKRRMVGCLASAIASLAFWVDASPHSMFDWPEPTQTSPTRTSVSSMVLLPLTVMVCGLALAVKAGSDTFQLPLSSALVVA